MSAQVSEPGRGHFVDGEWVNDGGSETFVSENPATGEPLGTFPRGTHADVERAVDAAAAAFPAWRSLSYVERAEHLAAIGARTELGALVE